MSNVKVRDNVNDKEKTSGFTLKPHQREGKARALTIHENKEANGIVFADDMGMGKTFMTLSTIEEMANRKYCRSVELKKQHKKEHKEEPDDDSASYFQALLVVPLGVMKGWRKEWGKMGGSPTVMQNFWGPKRVLLPIRKGEWRIVVTTAATLASVLRVSQNMEALRSRPKLAEKNKRERALFSMNWDLLVVDEGHEFGKLVPGPFKKVALPFYSHVFKALRRRFTIAITGTPVKNGRSSLESLLTLTGIPYPKNAELSTLITIFKRFSHRTVLTAAEKRKLLPAIHYRIHTLLFGSVTIEKRARELMDNYIELSAKVANYVSRGRPVPPKLKIKLVGAMARCRFYELTHTTGIEELARQEEQIEQKGQKTLLQTNAKLSWVIDYCKKEQKAGRKVVVTSFFKSFLDVIAPYLRRAGVKCAQYDGSINDMEKRGEVIDQFLNGPVSVLLLSKTAGGVGLNLAGVQSMVLLEPGHLHATEDQVAYRIVRMGTGLEFVTIHRLIYTHTSQKDKDKDKDKEKDKDKAKKTKEDEEKKYMIASTGQSTMDEHLIRGQLRKATLSSQFIPDEMKKLKAMYGMTEEELDNATTEALRRAVVIKDEEEEEEEEEAGMKKGKKEKKKKEKEKEKERQPHPWASDAHLVPLGRRPSIMSRHNVYQPPPSQAILDMKRRHRELVLRRREQALAARHLSTSSSSSLSSSSSSVSASSSPSSSVSSVPSSSSRKPSTPNTPRMQKDKEKRVAYYERFRRNERNERNETSLKRKQTEINTQGSSSSSLHRQPTYRRQYPRQYLNRTTGVAETASKARKVQRQGLFDRATRVSNKNTQNVYNC